MRWLSQDPEHSLQQEPVKNTSQFTRVENTAQSLKFTTQIYQHCKNVDIAFLPPSVSVSQPFLLSVVACSAPSWRYDRLCLCFPLSSGPLVCNLHIPFLIPRFLFFISILSYSRMVFQKGMSDLAESIHDLFYQCERGQNFIIPKVRQSGTNTFFIMFSSCVCGAVMLCHSGLLLAPYFFCHMSCQLIPSLIPSHQLSSYLIGFHTGTNYNRMPPCNSQCVFNHLVYSPQYPAYIFIILIMVQYEVQTTEIFCCLPIQQTLLSLSPYTKFCSKCCQDTNVPSSVPAEGRYCCKPLFHRQYN